MKKNKLMLSVLLSALYNLGHADLGAVHSEASGDPEFQQFIDQNNLPQPDGGIQIIPFSESSFAKENKLLSDVKDMEKLGYKKESSDDAKELLKTQKDKYYPGDKKTYENSDPYDTHLKASLSQIKLAFPFKGISFLSQNDVLGYAVSDTWKEGWTGVGELFLDHNIGICDYNKHNVALNHSSIRLVKEFVTYDINSKPTQVFASGIEKEGYSYKVEWFDNDYYHTLICANSKYSNELKEHTVALAKKIDADQNQ